MMSQFIMDLKAEHNATTKLLNHYNGYNLSPNSNSNDYSNEQTTTNGVLDLSRRRDSVETRKTPSPYSPSTFSEGSPSTHHGSPSISTTTTTNTAVTTANGTKIHFPIKRSSPIMLHHHNQHHHQQQQQHIHLQNMTQYHGTSPVSPVYPVFPGFPLQQFNHHAYHSDNDTTTGTTTAVAVAATTAAAAVLTANLYRSSPPVHVNNDEINHQFVLKTEDSNDADNNAELIKRLKDRKSDLSDADTDNESISVTSTGASSGGGGSNNNSTNSSKKYPMIVGRDGKLSRPFKAYPRDPMTLAASFTATDTLLDSNSAEKYNTFRKRMLEQIHAANGGTPTVSNPKMRRTTQQKFADDLLAEKTLSKFEKITNEHASNNNNNNNNNNLPSNNNNNNSIDNNLLNDNNNTIKDSAYFERRKKNNAAAKKSRDRRRIKEDEIAIRAAFLERENIELKFELAAARKQLQIYGVTTTSTTT